MQNEQSIFDEVIIEPRPLRRRDLLSTPLKIYVLLGIAAGTWLLLKSVFSLTVAGIVLSSNTATEIYMFRNVILPILLFGSLPGLILVIATFLVWMEARLAIRMNGLLFAIWCLYEVIIMISNGVGAFSPIIAALIVIPYFTMLFKIRNDWETRAVKI